MDMWYMWGKEIEETMCDSIVNTNKDLVSEKAGVYGTNSGHRRSQISWIQDDDLKNILWKYAQEANRRCWGIDVENCADLQYTVYDSAYEGKYDDHHDIDWNNGIAFHRKISMTIQLSDPEDYEGGDFEFVQCDSPDKDELRQKGSVLVFPSYVEHRVTKVTSGTRRSLVAWFEGPKWR